MKVSKTLASQLGDIHDWSEALPGNGSLADTLGRWFKNHGEGTPATCEEVR